MSSRPIASEAPGGRPRRLSNVSKMANMFEQQAVQQPPLSNLPVGGGANYSGQPPPSNPKQPPARPPKPPSRPPKPVNVLTPSGSPHSAPGSLQVAHSNTGSDRMYTTASGQRPVSPSRSMQPPVWPSPWLLERHAQQMLLPLWHSPLLSSWLLYVRLDLEGQCLAR